MQSVTPHPLRTTPVPDEIWEVAAVVLGEEQRTLTGWQYDEAIAAMAHLGDSITHIGWSLGQHPQTVEKRARQLGVPARRVDGRIDLLGVLLVALMGCRMRLAGRDRVAAIRLMAALGINSEEMARRLCMNKPASASKLAANHGIRPVAMNAFQCEVNAYRRRQDPEAVLRELIAA